MLTQKGDSEFAEKFPKNEPIGPRNGMLGVLRIPGILEILAVLGIIGKPGYPGYGRGMRVVSLRKGAVERACSFLYVIDRPVQRGGERG